MATALISPRSSRAARARLRVWRSTGRSASTTAGASTEVRRARRQEIASRIATYTRSSTAFCSTETSDDEIAVFA